MFDVKDEEKNLSLLLLSHDKRKTNKEIYDKYHPYALAETEKNLETNPNFLLVEIDGDYLPSMNGRIDAKFNVNIIKNMFSIYGKIKNVYEDSSEERKNILMKVSNRRNKVYYFIEFESPSTVNTIMDSKKLIRIDDSGNRLSLFRVRKNQRMPA